MFKPLGDRVLLKRIETDEKSAGGLLLPDSAKKPQNELEVVALGTDEEYPVKVGDVVLLDRYMGHEIVLDEKTYIIAKVSDIVGIL